MVPQGKGRVPNRMVLEVKGKNSSREGVRYIRVNEKYCSADPQCNCSELLWTS